jgi:capsular polysaccharide biosynthesis protein
MTTEQLIIEIKNRKFLILTSFVVIFFLSFFVQYRVLQTFHSTAKIIVNETNITDLTGPSQFIGDFVNTNASSVNRLFKFAYSSEMMNYLITKFHLYEYYKIDPASEFAYTKVVEKFSTRISLAKTEQNVIEITVTDVDRYQAASMANEMAYMLNRINDNYIKSQLRRKIALYGAIYTDVKTELEEHENKMSQLLDEYRGIIKTFEKNKMDVESLNYSLIELWHSLQSKKDEWVKMKQIYSTMLNTLEKEHLDTITIINIAQPDYHSNTVEIFVGSFFFSLLAVCVIILLLNFYLKNKEIIDLLFKKQSQKEQ